MAANRTTTIILAVAGGAAVLALVGILVDTTSRSDESPTAPSGVQAPRAPQQPVAGLLRPPTPEGVRRVPEEPPPVPEDSWTRLPSGVDVFDAVAGQGDAPQPDSGVKVDYTGWTDQGKVFESTYRRPEPRALLYTPGKMVPGLAEGLADMKAGGRRVIRVPPELAYSQAGLPQLQNMPFSYLIWEVELLSVTPPRVAPDAPPTVAADGWTTTESGLQYYVLAEGSGAPPVPGSTVVVEYTGWLEDGKRFDSSLDRAEPLDVDLSTARAGWAEGISAMLPGERRVLRIPPALGYGEKGVPGLVPPDATLTYEIQLLEVR